MTFLSGILAGLLLCLFFAFVMLLVVVWPNPPRSYQPLPPTRREPPPMPPCKPERDADFASGGISYTHLGMTGEEV
jgi:hypothetical protein